MRSQVVTLPMAVSSAKEPTCTVQTCVHGARDSRVSVHQSKQRRASHEGCTSQAGHCTASRARLCVRYQSMQSRVVQSVVRTLGKRGLSLLADCVVSARAWFQCMPSSGRNGQRT